MIVGCGDLTILLVGLGFHCFLLKCKEKLRHSLGRPSRSDFVQSKFMEVYIMRVIISIILMVIAALVGFFFGAGMNEAMGGAILLSMITGFACTINAIEKNKKD